MKAVELATLIPECCSEVLEAMYFTTLLDAHSTDAAPLPAPGITPETAPSLIFSLRFAGDVSGRFGLSMHPDTARSLAANFLGEDASGISPVEVSEVTGELANMLCGSVMSRVEGEHKFVLSHPEPSPLPPHSEAADTLVSTLTTDSGEIVVWVTIEGTR
jgi:Chemotaxis phosphatase CheX